MTELARPSSSLESETVFNWRNHLVFAIPAYLTAALFEQERFGGDPLLWFWVGTLGYAITAVTIELGARLYRRQSSRRWPVAIGILGVAGFLRGLTILLLGPALGLFSLEGSEVYFRLVGGPVFVISAYFSSNAVMESYLEFRRKLRELEQERMELAQLRAGYRERVNAATQRQRDRVTQLLTPAMWELQKLFEKSPSQVEYRQALIRLEGITNDVVRPVSQELVQTQSLSQVERAPFTSRGRLSFPDKIEVAESFKIWFFAIILLTVSLNAQIAASNLYQGILTVAAAAGPVLITLTLLRHFAHLQLGSIQLAVLHGVHGLVMGAFGGWLAVTLGVATTDALVWQASSYVFLASQLTYAFSLLNSGWNKTLDELAIVLTELGTVNARLRQQIWLRQRNLALELHGSIQSKLTALSKTISKMGAGDSEKITGLIVEIRESLNRLDQSDYLDGSSFENLVNDLQVLWEGTLEIEVEIGRKASSLLKKDEGIARCVFEVLREAVTNGVKHGDASLVRFQVNASELGVQLKIWNNGKPIADLSEAAGMKLLEQLSAWHKLENVEDGVLLRAEITTTLELVSESPGG